MGTSDLNEILIIEKSYDGTAVISGSEGEVIYFLIISCD